MISGTYPRGSGLIAVIWRVRRGIDRLTEFGVVMAAIFLLLSLPRIASGVELASGSPASEAAATPAQVAVADLPDIYYIILDGYGRGDVLEELYGDDNEPFLTGLEDR